MNPLLPFAADWAVIDRLLDEALDLPESDRGAWLESLSGDAARHRATLRALLAQQARVETDDFLVTLPRLPAAEAGRAPRPVRGRRHGGTVSADRADRRGRHGTVWLAERADGLVDRRVALKPSASPSCSSATRPRRRRSPS